MFKPVMETSLAQARRLDGSIEFLAGSKGSRLDKPGSQAFEIGFFLS